MKDRNCSEITRFEDFVSSGSLVKRVRRIDARLSSSMKEIGRLVTEQLCNIRDALICANHKFGEELVRERVEIHAVELGIWTTSKVGF